MSEKTENSAISTAPLAGARATLARRYAEALFELAEQEGAFDAVVADLEKLQEVWDTVPEWRAISGDPRLKAELVAKAAADMTRTAGVGKLVSNFVQVVAQHRRLPVLPAMIASFLNEVAGRRGEFRAEVRTAHALTSAHAEKLSASLGALLGGKVRLAVRQDAGLLGGLTVRVGSRFFDASVKTKLDLLERQLKAGAAA